MNNFANNTLYKITTVCLTALLGWNLFLGTALAKMEEQKTLKMVGTQKIESTLVVADKKIPVSGRISFSLISTHDEFKEGVMTVRGFNMVYFKVAQQEISGRQPRGKATGVVGFAIDNARNQKLKYYAKSQVLTGTLKGSVDFPQLADFSEMTVGKGGDDFMTPALDANLEVTIKLAKPIAFDKAHYEILTETAQIQADLYIYEEEKLKIREFAIYNEPLEIVIDYTILFFIEIAKRLTLQPVRVATFSLFPVFHLVNLSGDGLSFGTPGARTEWAKSDVIFTVRNFKTIYMFNNDYLSLSEAEASSLRSRVEDDDAIEVYFVDSFSPVDLWGGGATFSGGLASSQIISSDGNADGGIDFTHLAHELGHVMTLKHPGSGYPTAAYPYRYDGSSGTLLCPSGYLNDNPQINSQENKDNISNPLFTFSLKRVSAGPDCTDSADCGPCF
jgi:hypothetical protein